MSGDVSVPEDEQKRSSTDPGADPRPDPDPDDTEPADGRPRRHRVLRWLGIVVGLAVLAGAGTVWYGYQKYNRNITTDTTTETLLGPPSARPTVPAVAYDAENILIIGSDTRSGANGSYGANIGARSDTTILLHLSKDGTRAVAMSIPRDAMVHIPSCRLPNGGHTAATFAQFNWAYSYGGTACTIRTVEQLTKIRIDHFMVIDFNGFKNMVNAIGGVEVCLAKPVADRDAKLYLPAGKQTVNGTQALGFVRVRESIGDGSDTERMGRQQQFLSSLVQKIESNGVLLNPTKLLPLINAATSAMTVDPGLNTLAKLYDLATGLRSTPADHMVLLTAPREPYVNDHNRDQFKQPQANQLFKEIRDDDQVLLTDWATPSAAPGTGATSVPSSHTSTPAFDGRTADQDICSSS